MDFFQENLEAIMTGKVPEQRKIAKGIAEKIPPADLRKTIAPYVTDGRWEVRNFLAILLAEVGKKDPSGLEEFLLALAADVNWRVREAAASIIVEVGKKNLDWVLQTAAQLRQQKDPNQIRTGLEGLREIARKKPQSVILEAKPFLNHASKYVRDAAANLLRNASRISPDYVGDIISQWQREYQHDAVALRTLKAGGKNLE